MEAAIIRKHVETILMEAAFNKPNATTLAAMKEAQDESNLTTVDMGSFDSFLKSLDIEERD